jgi:CHRD domain
MKTLLFVAVTLTLASPAQSAIIFFDLLGTAGAGLSAANENPATTGGTGGEVGGGIFFDDVSKVLTINIAWGSGNGFTNLTGFATAGHLHATGTGGVASFTQNGGVILGLDSLVGWNSAAANGGFTNGTIALTGSQETALLAERTYINVHTQTNGGGEMRGNLVIVPEPSHAILSVIGLAAFGTRRKR